MRAVEWRMLREAVAGYRRGLVVVGMMAAIAAILEAAILAAMVPIAIAVTNARHTIETPWNTTMTVFDITLVGIGFVVLRAAVQMGQAIAAGRLISAFEAHKRRQLFEAYVQAGWEHKADETASRLQTMLTTNIDHSVILLNYLVQSVVYGAGITILLTAALAIEPLHAIGVMAVGSVLFLLLRPVARRTGKAASELVACNVEYGHEIAQNVALSREINVFGAEDAFKTRLGEVIERARRLRRTVATLVFLTPGIYTNGVLLVAFLWLLVITVAAKSANLAALGVIVLLLLRSVSYGQGLQMVVQRVSENFPYLSQFEKLLDHYRCAEKIDGTHTIDRLERIAFENVHFRYEPTTPTLTDVSFTVERGEVWGIVGRSGAGKSTLIQLLLRLRRPTTGRIVITATAAPSAVPSATALPMVVALDEIALASWFQKISYVPQEPVLLDDTIEANIRFFRKNLSAEDVRHAVKSAHIEADIDALPNGLATIVGDRGSRLSGGQRQRICIARALAGRPEILIFDEPTSALDAASEAAIQRTLETIKHTGTCTIFIIAHRETTLAACDKILTLDHGHLTAITTNTASPDPGT